MSDTDVLIVGAGGAGTAAARELRRLGYAGRVTLLNGEGVAPYNRTTVNKWLLEGRAVGSVAEEVPSDEHTSVCHGAVACRLDLADNRVDVRDSAPIRYRHLLVATGASPRTLPTLVADSAAVAPLRSAADVARLRSQLEWLDERRDQVRIVVVGRGLLGAETAETLARGSRAVHLVDLADQPLQPVLGSEIGRWVDTAQREAFTSVHVAAVQSINGRLGDLAVELTDGSVLHVDLAVVAIGVYPETGWLAGSGLEIADGVLVDERLRARGTTDVLAAGDLARTTFAGRTEHWSHARAQGAHAARVIAHQEGVLEDPGPFRATPSYATRLHGRPVSVIGRVSAEQREVVLAAGEDPAMRITVRVDETDRIRAAVVLGAPKIARQLQPLVESGAPLGDGDDIGALSA